MGGKDRLSSSSANLQSLPDKAVKTVVNYLNVWNLMNLRLVCKKTKSWVENPDVLQRIPVSIKERKFLRMFLKSKVGWSHLSIICDSQDISGEWIKSELYLNLFSKLNTSLRVLKLLEHRLSYNYGLTMIVRNCPNLHVLELGTLDLKKASLPLTDEFMDCIKSLQHLAISYVAWEKASDLQVLSQLLTNCRKLKFFKIPYILTASVYSLYPNLNSDEIDLKLEAIFRANIQTPLIKILENYKKDTLKYLDAENYDLDQLAKLIPVCDQSGCLLVNVAELLEKDLTKEQSNLLGGVIGSIVQCTNYLPFDKLSKLKSVTISTEESSDIDKRYSDVSLPSLKNVDLTLSNSILVSARVASCLLQTKRDSVENISVKFKDLTGSAQISVFKPVVFASSFPNLRHLRLEEFDGKPENYCLFWESFPLLEDVQLLNCRTLCDKGLTGSDESKWPTFLSLKYLRKLVLEYCDISDSSLENIISKLALETLSLSLPKVTFDGLGTLAKGPLINSLMMFQCMSPDHSNEDYFQKYFQQFKNLKKFTDQGSACT